LKPARYLDGALLMRKTPSDAGFSVPEQPLFLVASIRSADAAAAAAGKPAPFGGKFDAALAPFQSLVSNVLQVSCGKGASSRGPDWIFAAAAQNAVSSSLGGGGDGSEAGPAQGGGMEAVDAGLSKDVGGGGSGSGSGSELVLQRPATVAFAPAAPAGGRAFTLRRPALVAFKGMDSSRSGGGPAAPAPALAPARRFEMGARQRSGLQLPRLDLPGFGGRVQQPRASKAGGQQAGIGGFGGGRKSALVEVPGGGGGSGSDGGGGFTDHVGGVWEIVVVNGTTVARLKPSAA
jgi:hypothetical protein